MPREHQFFHRENGKIEYHEESGRLWYSWRDELDLPTQYHSRRFRIRETADIIPNTIINQGDKAIKVYAEGKVLEYLDQIERTTQEQEERNRNRNYLIEVAHRGVSLKGRIISTEDTTIRVRLEEPYQGEKFVIFGFASALAGHRRFDDQGNLTDYAVRTAEGLLKRVYDEQKYNEENKEIIELAARLNE